MPWSCKDWLDYAQFIYRFLYRLPWLMHFKPPPPPPPPRFHPHLPPPIFLQNMHLVINIPIVITLGCLHWRKRCQVCEEMKQDCSEVPMVYSNILCWSMWSDKCLYHHVKDSWPCGPVCFVFFTLIVLPFHCCWCPRGLQNEIRWIEEEYVM